MIFAVSCADGIKFSADKLTSGSENSNSGYNGGWDDDDDDDTSNGENPFKGTTWKQTSEGQLIPNGNTITFASSGNTVTEKTSSSYGNFSNSYTYTVSGSYTAKFFLQGYNTSITFTISGKDDTTAQYSVNGSTSLEYTKQ